MSVPLDRLYNFLHDHCDQDVLIYRWFPHGSRKVEDCKPLFYYTRFQEIHKLPMICHDQEPLKFSDWPPIASKIGVFRHYVYNMFNLYDRVLLLHSEQQSSELEKFTQSGAISVYYWSHALIARDWYRYADCDPVLGQKNIEKIFLIYNRAWSGTREYRLKFAELLVHSGIANKCHMGFNPTDQKLTYTEHQFNNKNLCIEKTNLENYFYLNQISSAASADYDSADYNKTGIEVVLETLFDDQRWHLTEKTLRPIACGQPFILAATPGSLEYLRSYGFKTFDPYIDETYDAIVDPLDRLQAIIAEMQRLANLSPTLQEKLFGQLKKISDFNKQRFFSQEFSQQITQEYKDNLSAAINQAKQYNCSTYFNSHRSFFKTTCSPEEYAEIVNYVENNTKNSTGLLSFDATD